MNYGGYTPPTDPVAAIYMGMQTLPQGAKTEKVIGRWYIVEEPGSRARKLLTSLVIPLPTYRVYELCYDLVFRTDYDAPLLKKGQAVQMALTISAAQDRALQLQPLIIPAKNPTE